MPLKVKPFTAEQTREIVFKTMLEGEVDHTIELDGDGAADYRSVVGYFARQLLKDLRLVGGYDQLYPKVKTFMQDHLFETSVDLADPVILRNLSEPEVGKVLFDSFRKAINALTIHDSGTSRVEGHIRLRDTRPFRTEPRAYLPAKKSVFNRIRRGGARGRSRTRLRRVSRRRGGRAVVREELSRGRLQARLRQSRRGALQLHAGFRRTNDRWRGLDRRDQGA